MNDVLERAKTVQNKADVWIKLSFLQDLIAEIERLRDEKAAVHGRPRVRSVGSDEG